MPVIDLDRLITSEILRPARYLGNEFGAAHRDWDSAAVRWVLTYPELYEVGASNSGHIILYNILNAQPRQLCDRTYLPGTDLIARLRDRHLPLFAVESRRDMKEFDIVGFSLAYELGGTNILEMLDLAGIPKTWQERNPFAVATYPLIFAGGPTATSNPEPFAEFFDFFVLGDGEEVLPEIGLVVEEGLRDGLSRRDLLLDLAQVPGVYVPQFYDGMPLQPVVDGVPARIVRRVANPMPHYAIGPIPYVETVHDRLSLEVRRGCTRGCRFCQPGMLTRPARDVAPDDVVEAIATGMQRSGYDEFSLSSLSCSDYLSLPAVGAELHNRLDRTHVNLSLPSQRVDRFDEHIAAVMGGTRRPTLTFAPEAGSQRMRDVINKGLTNADLVRGVKTAAEQGWDKVKLYFMIGLPGETDIDVVGIAETIAMLQRECRPASGRRLKVNVTISNFTPKPHTPFQWHRVDPAEIERKQRLLKDQFRRMKGVKGNFTDIRFSMLEDFIGKGDRRLSRTIERAWQQGAGMDSWWEAIDDAYAAWVRAYRETVPDAILAGEAGHPQLPTVHYDLDDPLPWDHVDTGIDKAWLQQDWARALEAATVPDCSFEGCSHCGICGVDFGHNIVIPARPIPEIAPKPQGKDRPKPVQRFRVTFSKQGSMRFVGHLDLLRLWERACRRANFPLAFTGGFHPSPRISTASALALGHVSRGEVLDIELTQTWDLEKFRNALAAQLPSEMEVLEVAEIPLAAPSATKALIAADYTLHVNSREPVDWEALVEQILARAEIWLDKVSKSGKPYRVNGRELLYELSIASAEPHSATIDYRGCCRNDGTMLRPEQAIELLRQQLPDTTELDLTFVERQQLRFQEEG
ncbi:TIGR03960 family B12-binding radical SAM protein [Synechococcus sp. PCC 7336]|uniref:TIGR03960 family B12-binding radical SAM protein n=1 Tax=Synechococcus sp. PCC 7336 TaxID=195250 RepID=UPI000347E7C3|nr:TIGR03960 family B12-binding radical SAM protein [Synechococcus sp. PCC 7336]